MEDQLGNYIEKHINDDDNRKILYFKFKKLMETHLLTTIEFDKFMNQFKKDCLNPKLYHLSSIFKQLSDISSSFQCTFSNNKYRKHIKHQPCGKIGKSGEYSDIFSNSDNTNTNICEDLDYLPRCVGKTANFPSSLQYINTPTIENRKNLKNRKNQKRKLYNFKYAGPLNTQEGKNCGIVKNINIFTNKETSYKL